MVLLIETFGVINLTSARGDETERDLIWSSPRFGHITTLIASSLAISIAHR